MGKSPKVMGLKRLLKGSKRGAGVLLIMVVVLFASCSTSKEVRRANRASKKLAKLTIKYPELLQRDTLRDTVSAIVTDVRIDTTFLKADTITVQKDRLRVQVITEHDTVRIIGECLGDTVYVPIEIPVKTIQPVEYRPLPLTWKQRILIGAGWLLFALLALAAVGRFLTSWLNRK